MKDVIMRQCIFAQRKSGKEFKIFGEGMDSAEWGQSPSMEVGLKCTIQSLYYRLFPHIREQLDLRLVLQLSLTESS